MRTHLAAPTARRAAQIAVWALLVAFVTAAAWSLTHPAHDSRQTTTYTLISSDGTHQALTDVDLSHLFAAGPGSSLQAGGKSTTGTEIPAKFLTGQSPRHWLPAARWDSVGLVGTNSHWYDPSASMVAAIGGFFFTCASWIWSATFGIVVLAMSMDVVASAGDAINTAAGTIGAGIWDSGLLALVIMLLVFVGAAMALRGGKGGMMRMAAGCIIPLAVMQVLIGHVADSQKGGGDPTKTAAYALTPAGLAERGNVAVSAAVEGIAVQMNDADLAKHATGPNATDAGTAAVYNPCEYYYGSLKKAYQKASGNQVGYTSSSVVLLSNLWQSTFVKAIADAQFGDIPEGQRAICHHMDWQQNTPDDEQAALAGTTDPASPFYGFATSGTGSNYSPFDNVADINDHNTSATAWIACDYESAGKATMSSAWLASRDHIGDDFNAFCEKWKTGGWDGGDLGKDTFEYHDGKDTNRDFKTGTVAYKVIVANLGQTGQSQRMTQGLAAVLSAGAYFIALVIPAFGCALATAGLALMLALLPFTMLMLALPSKKGITANGTGLKMLKLTGSFILSKSMFLVMLALLIQFVTIFNIVLGVGRS